MIDNIAKEILLMRQPLWLLNFLLLITLLFVAVFIAVTKVIIPQKRSLLVTEIEHKQEAPASKIDPSIIYTKDLFGTLQQPVIKKEEEHKTATVPTPTRPIPVQIPKPAPVKFLEPLPITLTGIIFFDDKEQNRAIILNNRTKKEGIYKFEDEIEDAQLIRILKDRVILLRSNSQQETVYLKQDLNLVEDLILTKDWSKIVLYNPDGTYDIDAKQFVEFIPSLSEFIFKFNLKTATKNGQPIGLLVGELENNSLAKFMGLNSGDIIESIDSIPATTQQNRLHIYNKILAENPDKISVEVNSNGAKKTIIYKLIKTYKQEEAIEKKLKPSHLTKPEIEEQHKKFSKTLDRAKLRDKKNMFKYKKSNLENHR